MTWWERKNPEEIRCGFWLHPAAALYFESLLRPEQDVIEHGCGGSTLYIASKVRNVYAFDSDTGWMEKVLSVSPANVTLFTDRDPFSIPQRCDILFIDGDRKTRGRWIKAAPQLVRRGGIVVLDNANRPEYEDERQYLQSVARHYITLTVNPPKHQYAVTEFYRMDGGIGWI